MSVLPSSSQNITLLRGKRRFPALCQSTARTITPRRAGITSSGRGWITTCPAAWCWDRVIWPRASETLSGLPAWAELGCVSEVKNTQISLMRCWF